MFVLSAFVIVDGHERIGRMLDDFYFVVHAEPACASVCFEQPFASSRIKAITTTKHTKIPMVSLNVFF